jgi:hypothetical protein
LIVQSSASWVSLPPSAKATQNILYIATASRLLLRVALRHFAIKNVPKSQILIAQCHKVLREIIPNLNSWQREANNIWNIFKLLFILKLTK